MAGKRRDAKRQTWALTRRLNPVAAAALLEVLRRAAPCEATGSEVPARSGVNLTIVSGTPPAPKSGWKRRKIPASAGKFQPSSKPVLIGKRWLIIPTSLRTLPRSERILLRIEPGMAFGSGEHETTRLCLQLIETLEPRRSFLDVGTGSGILAIAALKHGFHWALGFDSDAVALRHARINARINDCSNRLRLLKGCLTSWKTPAPFEVIAANLLAGLLSTYATRLASWLAPSGTLIASGFLRGQERQVREAFRVTGLHPVRLLRAGHWSAYALARPPIGRLVQIKS